MSSPEPVTSPGEGLGLDVGRVLHSIWNESVGRMGPPIKLSPLLEAGEMDMMEIHGIFIKDNNLY